jgi:hypothetical protein
MKSAERLPDLLPSRMSVAQEGSYIGEGITGSLATVQIVWRPARQVDPPATLVGEAERRREGRGAGMVV